MPDFIPFTKEGFQKLQDEFDTLSKKRPIAVEELKRARELGDLSENGAYKAARFELSSIDSRLRRLTMLLRRGKVEEKEFRGVVDFGTSVTVESEGKTSMYTIVGGLESNPQEGKLSQHSPLGRLLMGKRQGDVVELFAPIGRKTYRIVSISL